MSKNKTCLICFFFCDSDLSMFVDNSFTNLHQTMCFDPPKPANPTKIPRFFQFLALFFAQRCFNVTDVHFFFFSLFLCTLKSSPTIFYTAVYRGRVKKLPNVLSGALSMLELMLGICNTKCLTLTHYPPIRFLGHLNRFKYLRWIIQIISNHVSVNQQNTDFIDYFNNSQISPFDNGSIIFKCRTFLHGQCRTLKYQK